MASAIRRALAVAVHVVKEQAVISAAQRSTLFAASEHAGWFQTVSEKIWMTSTNWWEAPQTMRFGWESLGSEQSESNEEDVLAQDDGVLFAAPKRKQSPSRRKLRQFQYRIKEKTSFKACALCGELHLPHHLCPFCHPFNNWTIKKHIPPPNREFK